MLRRVLEKKEPLPQVAEESHVSHETIRRVILAATKEHGQHESPYSTALKRVGIESGLCIVLYLQQTDFPYPRR